MAAYWFWIKLSFLVLLQSFHLEADKHAKKPAFVLLGLQAFIGQMDLDGKDFGVYLYESSGNINVYDLDTDIRNGHIFWVDRNMKHIKQGTIDHVRKTITNVSILVASDYMIEGLAWDWVNYKLFWTAVKEGDGTMESTIEVIDPRTGCRSLLSVFGDGTRAGSIVVDPIRSWLFWTDTNETTAKIVRMAMDGTSFTVIANKADVTSLTGLSFDYDTQTLFWLDGSTNEIVSVDINGNQRTMVAHLQSFYNMPNGFRLEFFGGQLYFGDKTDDLVLKLTSLNSDKNVTKLQQFSYDATVIRVIDIARQPARLGKNPCLVNNGNCDFTCLLNPSGYSCLGPVNRLTCKQTLVPKKPIIPNSGFVQENVRSNSVSGTPKVIGGLLVAIAVMTTIIM